MGLWWGSEIYIRSVGQVYRVMHPYVGYVGEGYRVREV